MQLLVQLLLPAERSRSSDVQLTAAALENDHEVILTALKSIINIFNVFELQVRPVEIAALMSRVCHGASALHLHTPLFRVATLTKYILVLLYVCMCVCVYVCVGGV